MSRTPALVSVVVPALNATPVIDVQLAALAGQDYPGEFEVIVADNGSTDGLARHLSGHPLAERLRLRRVDAGAAPGAAYARNVGVDAARGDFVVFCDADDQAHPQWLRRLVARAADFDAVSGPVETTTLNSARTAEWTPVNAPDVRTEVPGLFPVAGSCNLGMWRSTIDKVGPWDVACLGGGEDVDYCLRIQLAGLTFGHEPEAMMSYRVKSSYPQLWRQQYAWALSDVDTFVRYRDRGHRRRNPLLALAMPVLLVLRNPLLPQSVTKLQTGTWICYLAGFAGRIRGSIRHGVLYV
ncbi:glycosyltransferase [Prescottella agglutinans]|uniref:Glycosyltransferase involved in cell wall biosynthesis n=1 Tax=Prescottella agglutinans TaxID=1644129 RepID=A0ABT6MBD7_9NOCA|nr:glycosyltransferase [Prescottella agglutinans]MDH6281625.1 glycosyltransferase involved in cell wall biosynthesis [Prescottella agglutinans]